MLILYLVVCFFCLLFLVICNGKVVNGDVMFIRGWLFFVMINGINIKIDFDFIIVKEVSCCGLKLSDLELRNILKVSNVLDGF